MNELIIVKQLPIIEEHLMALKAEIEEKASRAMNLVCTDETVKDIKVTRAELNAEFKELETQRIMVKAKVLEPYEAFEKVYKDCVSEIYKKADADLKKKIDEVEQTLKDAKQMEIEAYYLEYAESKGIDFIAFPSGCIKVGLSDSMKSLKEKAKAFIDKIVEDVSAINSLSNADAVMAEYRSNGFNPATAISTVTGREKALEEMRKRREEMQTPNEVAKPQQQKAEQSQPTPVDKPEKQYAVTFTVYGTNKEFGHLKEFLDSKNYRYEFRK